MWVLRIFLKTVYVYSHCIVIDISASSKSVYSVYLNAYVLLLKTKCVDFFIFLAINQSTVSIALPGSILENAQSPELRTYLAGQVSF